MCGFDKLIPCSSEIQNSTIEHMSQTVLGSLKAGGTFAARILKLTKERIQQHERIGDFVGTPLPVVTPVNADSKSLSSPFDELRPTVPVLAMPALESAAARLQPTDELSKAQLPALSESATIEPEAMAPVSMTNIHQFRMPAAHCGELEVVTTRRKLAELKSWFENYDRNGLLIDRSPAAGPEDIAA
ncbi:MAG: hypothetical protein K2W95_26160 [Candidatus Obscuribacterales bacterium]|nr:hypothetical protein [Candidatus Obscuribacterales bacterium]